MLSVIIGTLNNERALVRTLAALVPAAATGVVREVIVTDGGSRDDTLEVADIAGCTGIAGDGPLGQRLKSAAATARSQWLVFLQPGTILEPTWADEVAQFAQHTEMRGNNAPRAATFRRGVNMGGSTTMLGEALNLLRASLTGTLSAKQGLVIGRRHYENLGGHSATAADPEADLLRRIGRRRIVRLRSGATKLENG